MLVLTVVPAFPDRIINVYEATIAMYVTLEVSLLLSVFDHFLVFLYMPLTTVPLKKLKMLEEFI